MKGLMRNALSVSVALAVMASASLAYADTQKDEEDDSVYEWGPWGTVQTAAGPGEAALPLIIAFANSRNTTDGSDFVPGISVPEEGSEFREYMAWYSRNAHSGDRKYERAFFESREAGFDGPEGQPSFDFSVATEAGEQTFAPEMLLVGNSGVKGAGYSASEMRYGSPYWSYRHKYQERYTDSENFDYSSIFNPIDEERELTEEDVAYLKGQWSDETYTRLYKKWRGRGSWYQIYSRNKIHDMGFFVSGNTSTLASINRLIAGNVEASYYGSFMTSAGDRGYVGLNLDFGDNSWSGNFRTPTSSDGNEIRFDVNDGVINGVDLSGTVDHTNKHRTTFFTYQQDVTGGVDASFFGSNVQHVNGIVDVDAVNTKTGNISGHQYYSIDDNYVGVFTTNQIPDDIEN